MQTALIFGAGGQDGHYLAALCKARGIAPVGCSVLAYEYFNIDMFEAAHGRAMAASTRCSRDPMPG